MLTIGSLCTGYGGLDMAVQSVLGGRVAWVSDIAAARGRLGKGIRHVRGNGRSSTDTKESR